MTPTEQDKLREQIETLVFARFYDVPKKQRKSIVANLLKLITANRKRVALEARLDETRLWYNDWGMSDETIGDGSWEDFYEYRIATLKQELEKL